MNTGGFKLPHHTWVSCILDPDWLQTSCDVTKTLTTERKETEHSAFSRSKNPFLIGGGLPAVPTCVLVLRCSFFRDRSWYFHWLICVCFPGLYRTNRDCWTVSGIWKTESTERYTDRARDTRRSYTHLSAESAPGEFKARTKTSSHREASVQTHRHTDGLYFHFAVKAKVSWRRSRREAARSRVNWDQIWSVKLKESHLSDSRVHYVLNTTDCSRLWRVIQ